MRLVVKLGGEALANRLVLGALATDLAALQSEGARVVAVHGGGPQADALGARLGLTRNVVAGRRITDEATLEVIKMAVAGQAGTDLAAALRAAGARALAFSGVSAGVVDAARRPPRVVAGGGDAPIDFGHVGDVAGIGAETLEALLDAGLLPVLACLGGDSGGGVFNINADVIATACAVALSARLILLTGAPGVLADPDDAGSRLPSLDPSGFSAAVAAGSVRAGMLPKLEESFRALSTGRVPAIHIAAAATPGAIRRELDTPGSVGTVLLP